MMAFQPARSKAKLGRVDETCTGTFVLEVSLLSIYCTPFALLNHPLRQKYTRKITAFNSIIVSAIGYPQRQCNSGIFQGDLLGSKFIPQILAKNPIGIKIV